MYYSLSNNIKWYYSMLYYIIYYCVIVYQNISGHIASYPIISYYIALNNIILVILYYIILYHIISHCIMSYYILLYYIILYHIISHCIMSYHITVISYYIIVYYMIYTYGVSQASWMHPRSSLRSGPVPHPACPLQPPRHRRASDRGQGAAAGWHRRHPQGISSCSPAKNPTGNCRIGKWRSQRSANCCGSSSTNPKMISISS